MRRKPLSERFWNKVAVGLPGECWEFQGARDQRGYGWIAGENGGKILSTHRVSWILHHGGIPKGMLVCHHCDNPPCVNPAHLFVGTQKDNVHDMMKKGRDAFLYRTRKVDNRGEKHYGSIVTRNQVREIREKHAAGKHSYPQLAREYNMSRNGIGKIVRRTSWAWLE